MSQRGISRDGGRLFADPGQDGLLHRAFLRGGFSAEDVRRSPVIGIASSARELNPCNAGLGDLAAEVKAGVREAGGLPLQFPTISISEPYTRPTSLYLRNLMPMDVEEMILPSPIDGVILLGGCDKTIPAQLMGAISADIPALMLAAGPRPVSCFQDNDAFTVDDVWPVCEKAPAMSWAPPRRWRPSPRCWASLRPAPPCRLPPAAPGARSLGSPARSSPQQTIPGRGRASS